MDEAESFLMNSRVRSIWPHSRASWCVGFVECVDRAEGRSVGRCRPITFSGCVAGGRIARAIARLALLHSNRGRTRVFGRSCQRAGDLFSCVIGIPHCACGLVGRRIKRSRLRRPHAVGGRVSCAARVNSCSARVAVNIEVHLWSTAI